LLVIIVFVIIIVIVVVIILSASQGDFSAGLEERRFVGVLEFTIDDDTLGTLDDEFVDNKTSRRGSFRSKGHSHYSIGTSSSIAA